MDKSLQDILVRNIKYGKDGSALEYKITKKFKIDISEFG